MFSFLYADQSVMSKAAVIASARTGDLILYAGAPTPIRTRSASPNVTSSKHLARRKSNELSSSIDESIVPTIGPTQLSKLQAASLSCSSLLAMLAPAIAFAGGGERESSACVDCVGVVVETPSGGEAGVLIYDAAGTLFVHPLSNIVNRPACLRPLMILSDADTNNSVLKRQALHKFLRAAVEDLCSGRLSSATHAQVAQSQIALAAHLLFAAGVLAQPPHEFCAPRGVGAIADVAHLFGADALHLDAALTRDYAYAHQIWMSS